MKEKPRRQLSTGVACLATAAAAVAGASMMTSPATGASPVNAGTLNGYHANELVRASYVSSNHFIDEFTGCSWQPIVQNTVSVPAKGYLMVTGLVDVERDFDHTNAPVLDTRLRVGTKVIDAHSTTAPDYTRQEAVLDAMTPVTKGLKTVRIQGEECTGEFAFIETSSIRTLFVPFGSTRLIAKSEGKQQNSRAQH
ncbi:MAG: hypothetical protein ACR2LE_01110 [Nocardioidaceae bacterium]